MSEQIEFIAFDGLMGTFEEVFERNNEEILRRAKHAEMPDSEIADLERAVVEAAVRWRTEHDAEARYCLEIAVDALIAVREKGKNG